MAEAIPKGRRRLRRIERRRVATKEVATKEERRPESHEVSNIVASLRRQRAIRPRARRRQAMSRAAYTVIPGR